MRHRAGAALRRLGTRLRDERGDGLISWVVLAVGLAAAAATVVSVLRPAIQQAAGRIVTLIAGAG